MSRIVVVLPTVSQILAVISVRWLLGEKNADRFHVWTLDSQSSVSRYRPVDAVIAKACS